MSRIYKAAVVYAGDGVVTRWAAFTTEAMARKVADSKTFMGCKSGFVDSVDVETVTTQDGLFVLGERVFADVEEWTEAERAEQRKVALAKLTPEDKKALGL